MKLGICKFSNILLAICALVGIAGSVTEAMTKSEAIVTVPRANIGAAEVPFLYDYTNKRINLIKKATCLVSFDEQSVIFDFNIPKKVDYKPSGLDVRDGAIWNDDRIEVFLQPYGTASMYQFIVNATGTLYDSRDKDKAWNGSVEYKVQINTDSWNVHMRVPFSDMSFDLSKGATFKCNVAVASNEPGNTICLTWNQLPIDFMDVSLFGTLRLSTYSLFVKSVNFSEVIYSPEGALLTVDYSVMNPSDKEQAVATTSGSTAVPAGSEVKITDKIKLDTKSIAVMNLSVGEAFKYNAEVVNSIVPQIELVANNPYDFTVKIRNVDVMSRFVDSVTLSVDGKKVLNCALSELNKKVLSTKTWKPGDHKFEYTFLTKDGVAFTKASENVFTFKQEKSGYSIASLDASRYYAPVSYKNNVVSAARSIFDLSKGILPSQIKVENRKVLDKPISIMFDGKTLPLNGAVRKVSSNKNQVRLVSTSKAGDKTVTVQADHQYDGYTWYDITIKSNTQFEYGPLDVVIPLKLDSDIIMNNEMFYYDELFGKQKITNIGAPTDIRGIDYNNKFIPHARLLKDGENLKLPLTSWISLSTDTDEKYRGLGISSEGPTGWNLKSYDNVYQITRGTDGRVSLVMHISDGLTRWKTREVKFSFGIEPFPVRKYNNNFHRDFRFDLTFWPKAYECIDKTVAGESMPFFDRLAKDGVTIELCHERWTEFENYWHAGCNEADILKTIPVARKAGIDLFFYFGFLISNKIPEFPLYHDIVMTKPSGYPDNGFKPYAYYQQGDPDQAAFGVCYNSIWGDRFIQGVSEAIKRYNLAGVYYDGGPLAAGCANLKHGCGVIDRYGRLIVTIPVRAYRRMGEAIYNAGIKIRPEFATDIGLNAPTPPAMGLAGSYWTGEGTLLFDTASRVRPEDTRGLLNGKLYGIPCDLIKRPEVSLDTSWAESLIMDTYPRLAVGGGKEWVQKTQKVWALYDKYQLTSDTFTPFYTRSNKVVSDNKNIYISYYETSKVLVLVVSNYWTEQEQKVNLDLSAFTGLNTKVRDTWFDEDFTLSNNKVSLTIPWGYMRLLVIEK